MLCWVCCVLVLVDFPISFRVISPALGQSYIDGLVQERHNSSALAMELCLSCIKPIDIWLSLCQWNNPERYMIDIIKLMNIASDNGLLPDYTKPSPEPMLTYHQ